MRQYTLTLTRLELDLIRDAQFTTTPDTGGKDETTKARLAVQLKRGVRRKIRDAYVNSFCKVPGCTINHS